jgi:3-methyladenine DNA glycosylase AlkD
MKRAKSKIPTSASKPAQHAAVSSAKDIKALVAAVLEALQVLADPERKRGHERYFKGTINSLGIPMAAVMMVARQHAVVVRNADKEVIFAVCEALFKTGGFEASIIACHWSRLPRKHYTASDIGIFGHWLDNYVSNWATCDTFCNHSVAAVLEQYPHTSDTLLRWARSRNRWVRRGAAVSLIVPAKKGMFTNTILAIAAILLQDKDDMVQKGYGWMLKEAYAAHPGELEAFIRQHAGEMPRTAFRYAIEKWPPAKRKQAMAINT